jgi:hypothetical protein
MDIKVTSCTTHQPLYLAVVTDIYGNQTYTDSNGYVQIIPGDEDEYYGTVVSISANYYVTNEFTLSSYGENDFCLQPVPTTGTGTGTGTSGSLY